MQDEDADGNVFVAAITPGGRAEKSGMVFKGDRIVRNFRLCLEVACILFSFAQAMCSATFGDDMWSCRGVGLNRVLASIKVRNTKPGHKKFQLQIISPHEGFILFYSTVRLVLEAPNEAEEKKRRAIAFAEASEEEKAAIQKVIHDFL